MNLQLTDDYIDDVFKREANIIELLDVSPVMFIITNKEGFFVRVSKSWETITGFSREELMSEPWLNFIHPDDHEKSMEKFKSGELFDGDFTAGFRNRYKLKKGGWVTLEWFSTGRVLDGLSLAISIPRSYE